jgi:imidazolonepropionase-like amidohydrolase
MTTPRSRLLNITVWLALALVTPQVDAQPSADSIPSAVLFTNVNVFDGTSATLHEHYFVLIRGNVIAKVSATKPEVAPNTAVTVVDGGGRVLMPGLIDDHWHTMFAAASPATVISGDPNFTAIVAAKEAEATLMRGFTSVRDMAGSSFGLKEAIDRGITVGPRIWPSGAIISQTGGHGDFRTPTDLPASDGDKLPAFIAGGHSAIADGAPEVYKRSREQLMRGASQLKLGAGGGIVSKYDPIDVAQYSLEEISAAVNAADAWNTYVTVHAYTPKAIQTAIQAGVKCIDHGHLMDEKTAKMMADKGIWLSTQPFLASDEPNPLNPDAQEKEKIVTEGTDRVYALAKKYHLKTAFGTDIMFETQKGGADQSKMLVSMTRWYTPHEVLKMATADNAELLALSGPRSPYPKKLGVIEEGAYADILVVDGNPLKNLQLLANPQANLSVIMKDGKFFKNTLELSRLTP